MTGIPIVYLYIFVIIITEMALLFCFVFAYVVTAAFLQVDEMIGVSCASCKAISKEQARVLNLFHQSIFFLDFLTLGVILAMGGRRMLMSS